MKQWCLRVFRTTFLMCTVVPMLYEGHASMNRLPGLTKCVLAKLGEEMERSEAVLLQALRPSSFRCVVSIIRRSSHR